MSDIYEQHTAAFASVSAYVITKDGQKVATIAFKHPRDGAGRLYAYVHWLGLPMVRGFANGYGYDKASAACAVAARKLWAGTSGADELTHWTQEQVSAWQLFRSVLANDNGFHWDSRLERAGFAVLKAI